MERFQSILDSIKRQIETKEERLEKEIENFKQFAENLDSADLYSTATKIDDFAMGYIEKISNLKRDLLELNNELEDLKWIGEGITK